MSRASGRWGIATYALIAVVGLAAVVYAAATDERSGAFSLDVPPSTEVAMLSPQESACEGPIETVARFAGLRFFVVPASVPGAAFELTVRDARNGALLAGGRLPGGYTKQTDASVMLDSTVPAGRRVEVCLHNQGPTRAAPLGGETNPTNAGGLVESLGGKLSRNVVSLVFLRRHPRSLLSLMPTVFERAALFHPRWVGAWTFWVLSGAVLAAFALGGVAIARAARCEERGDEPAKPL